MTDEQARQALEQNREQGKFESISVSEIPEDLEVATLEDVEDVKDEFTIVPIQGKKKVNNWVVRKPTAGDRAAAERTMFPKSALKQAQSKANRGKRLTSKDIGLEQGDMMEAAHRKNVALIQICVVHPKGATSENIENLPVRDFDRLLEAVEEDANTEDVVSRFPEDDSRPENGGESQE